MLLSAHFEPFLFLFVVYPFYDSNEEDVAPKVTKGLTAPIDPRYMDRTFAEAKIAEIIPQCWIYDAKQRIDIVYLANFLRSAVRENRYHEQALRKASELRDGVVVPVVNK